jgi:prephenate dehydratase
MIKVAYLGIKGAFSEQAARAYFGHDLEDVTARSFADIFQYVKDGSAAYGILPIENSLAGTVANSYELLSRHDISIQGEIVLHIQHALLALPGVTLAQLDSVRSHPQALEQCAGFIAQHNLSKEVWYNTAGSAKDLVADGLTTTGAIASEHVAQIYGLDVLATDIQDDPENYTRFVVLGQGEAPRAAHSKTSLMFTVMHKPGSLVDCLQVLASRGINLTKIESRPRRGRPWEYIFYVDIDGHKSDDSVLIALDELEAHTDYLRVLGSYPGHQSTA